MERRKFIRTTAAIGLSGSVAAAFAQRFTASAIGSQMPQSNSEASELPRALSAGELRGEMLYRSLGRTGEQVSAIGLGGSHIGKPGLQQSEAIRLMHEAVDRGITFMDNSWDYNEGQSETRMGIALSQGGYRNKVFLMTKIDGRTKEEAARQIESSLERLKTDRIDLLQHHEILRFDEFISLRTHTGR